MFSHMNLLSPAIGHPIALSIQDMLIEFYVLVSENNLGIFANRYKFYIITEILKNNGWYIFFNYWKVIVTNTNRYLKSYR